MLTWEQMLLGLILTVTSLFLVMVDTNVADKKC